MVNIVYLLLVMSTHDGGTGDCWGNLEISNERN